MRTAAILVLLSAATLAARVPLLAPRLAHWDAINYALGLRDFNIAAHQPHPPGSPYFILAGRAALALVNDDNAALLLLTLIASAAAVAVQYLLVRRVFGPAAAVVGSVIFMTHPVFWGYGTIATAWTLLALISASIALFCVLLLRGRSNLVYPSAAFMALASGFRADAVVFLAPLWLWAICTAAADWRRRTLALGLLIAGASVWFVPVAAGAGGVAAWSERLVAMLPSNGSDPAASVRQLAANTAIAFGTLAFTVGPATAIGFVLARDRAMTWLRATLLSKSGLLWALWILPAFTFLWLVDSTEPGHDLVFTGALVALGAGLLAHTAVTSTRLLATGALVVALQAGTFLFAMPQTGRPFSWTINSMLLNVTAPGIHQQQFSLDSALRTIRAAFQPDESIVVTLVGQDMYRFMMYYLPEYTVVRLDPPERSVLTARGRTQANWVEAPGGCVAIDAKVHHVVWVLSSSGEPGTFPENVTPISEAGPFQVWAEEVNTAPVEYLGLRIGRQSAC